MSTKNSSTPEPSSSALSTKVSRPITDAALRILAALDKKQAQNILEQGTLNPRSNESSPDAGKIDQARKLFKQVERLNVRLLELEDLPPRKRKPHWHLFDFARDSGSPVSRRRLQAIGDRLEPPRIADPPPRAQ
jgi:hypothetical protein